jgi:hypothetical protein
VLERLIEAEDVAPAVTEEVALFDAELTAPMPPEEAEAAPEPPDDRPGGPAA